jgi:hypothetical protein
VNARSQFGGFALALLAWWTTLGATPPVQARDIGEARSAVVHTVPGPRLELGEARIVSFGLFGRESEGLPCSALACSTNWPPRGRALQPRGMQSIDLRTALAVILGPDPDGESEQG